MSGAQTSRSCYCNEDEACRALNVLTLNSSVPIDCTDAAPQSIRCGWFG
jgi:hypothetical protein